MRVVVNQLAALKQRTGVGHYTAELLRCLYAQTPPGTISAFPHPFLHRMQVVWSWLRRRLSGAGAASARELTRTIIGRTFRFLSRHRYDLYHEPNFLPLPCDLPTVATLHDLSVLL